ncbi:MAG: hypothetical protein ABW321_25185 [Polyangiales bacterium]
MTDSAAERVQKVLAAPDSSLRADGVRLFVEHVLGLRLDAVVDLREVHGIVLAALSRENLARIVERHVLPGWERYSASVSGPDALDTKVGDLVDAPARAGLVAIAEELRLPRAKWAVGALDPILLQRLLAPVWGQVLAAFARRVLSPNAPPPAAAASGQRGLAGKLTRSVQQRAEKLVDAGRSVMEGLGIDVEQKLITATRDFSDNALAMWNTILRERLESEEGKALVAQINRGVVLHVLGTRLRDLQRDAAELPVDKVLTLIPDLVAHAAHGDFVETIVQRELSAFLAHEGGRTVGELLDELGLREQIQALALRRGDALFRSLIGTPAFADWLRRVQAVADGGEP